MRFLNMSNTPSSGLNSSADAHCAAVRRFVDERAGRTWCLFVDRDGVLNRQIVGDYVRSWRQFEWLPRAKDALKILSDWAPHLVVVTNQQGIGKGLMASEDVAAIHRRLQAELATDHVLLDSLQVCPPLESEGCPCRKPRTGLVLDWLRLHRDSEQSLSIMVGDSQSDLELANNVAALTGGCASIRIGSQIIHGAVADASFDSLWDFAVAVQRAVTARGA